MSNKRVAFVSEDLPDIVCKKIEDIGYRCVFLPKCESLDTPVASHPDMLFSVLDDGALLCDGEYYEKNKRIFSESGAKLVISKSKLGKKYPQDIAFDALKIGGTVYGKIDFIAPEILQNAKKAINVSQGYTLCSTLVTERCAVTADEGIYQALLENGVDVLKISPSGIALDGYGCGFIGGASMFDPISNTVVFFGDIFLHPSGNEICHFLKANGYTVCDFSSLPLKDYGGAKLIKI